MSVKRNHPAMKNNFLRQRLFCSIWCLIICLSGPALGHALSIAVFTDRASWEAAATGTIFEESFGDSTLNTEITVQTDIGYVSNGVWWDRMSTESDWSTTFTFSPETNAFGGEWDLAVPGGPGQGILVRLPYSTGSTVLSIDRTTEGTFWGFVSDTPFASVTLEGGTQEGWAETFEMDNLVYSRPNGLGETGGAVPEPTTVVLFGTGLAGLLGWRIWQGKTEKEH